ncbi:hypothetical protein RCJ22_25895, partial [Vibrio sp. FNV 38]|nr:hypothetical protein [Vibrio sp. FNV 38]
MNIDLVISLMVIVSGGFSIFCYFPKFGKILVPNLHQNGASKLQLQTILITGILGVSIALYSIF